MTVGEIKYGQTASVEDPRKKGVFYSAKGDGEMEPYVIDSLEQTAKDAKNDLITSIYDERIQNLIKYPSAKTLGDNWKERDSAYRYGNNYNFSYKLLGDRNSNLEVVFIDGSNNSITICAGDTKHSQVVTANFNPETLKIIPSTIAESVDVYA